MPSTRAIILNQKPFGETAAILTLLSEEEGLARGLATLTKKNRATLQPGNVVRTERWRRLEEQLGKLTVEEEWSAGPLILGAREGSLLVGWLSELCITLLPEGHAYPALFAAAESVLRAGAGPGLWLRVTALEKLVLSEVGYGLSLTAETAAAGADDPPTYVSPNTGRAVGQKAGEPYAGKLLPLPHIWGGPPCDEAEDAARALAVTGHFLRLAAHQKGRWEARARLAAALTSH